MMPISIEVFARGEGANYAYEEEGRSLRLPLVFVLVLDVAVFAFDYVAPGVA